MVSWFILSIVYLSFQTLIPDTETRKHLLKINDCSIVKMTELFKKKITIFLLNFTYL